VPQLHSHGRRSRLSRADGVSLRAHGMMPTNVAARMTLAADPGSLQGAVAAGILGCGPVILGTSQECARLLEQAQDGADPEFLLSEIRESGGRAPATST
jgi:citrate synthase